MAVGRNEYHKFRKQFKRRKISKKAILIIICIILAAITIVFGGYYILKVNGKNSLKKDVDFTQLNQTIVQEENVEELEDGVIRYNGTKYMYNENLITILCMGVDTSATRVKKNIPGNNGQADAIFLILFNEKDKTVKLINVPRDIIGDVQEYDKNGMPYQRIKEQIALQFAYGDGKEQSCKLMKNLVSKVLYGLPINAYAAINMDAIGVLNDQVGGVTVTVEDNFTKIDSSFSKGATLHLNGIQANKFVRMRDMNITGSNLLRIGRQKQYLTAFVNTAIPAMKGDMTLPVKMFNAVTKYMTTDITVDKVTYLTELAVNSQIDINNIQVLPGSYQQGEVYDEYILDENALYEMILQNFYIEVE